MTHTGVSKKCESPEYIIFYNGPRYGPDREAGESGPARSSVPNRSAELLWGSGPLSSDLLPSPAGNGVEQGVSSGLLQLPGLQPSGSSEVRAGGPAQCESPAPVGEGCNGVPALRLPAPTYRPRLSVTTTPRRQAT